MFQELIHTVKKVYETGWSLILTAFLGAATVAMWHFYQAEQLQSQFQAEGQLVSVQIERTDRKHREVWDVLGNFVYVGFTYHNQPYETRCVNDSSWLSTGDRITLLYHPQLNAFGQPERVKTVAHDRVVSRLIDWTIIRDFKPENKLLGGFILTALSLFFFAGGAIVSLTGWTFIQTIARLLLTVVFGAGALFFTYDTVHYYQYANDLRTNGQLQEVVVVDTDRHTRGRHDDWYTYDATFRFKGQDRVIPIDEPDYDRLTSGTNRLAVRYNPVQNDFMAVNYSPGFSQLIMPVFFWFLFIVIIRETPARLNRHVSVSQTMR